MNNIFSFLSIKQKTNVKHLKYSKYIFDGLEAYEYFHITDFTFLQFLHTINKILQNT